jgi:aspartyl-tRNA(Asn)/glutamyl-tRNA(Gln) amidotransferase subunit B
MSNKDYKLTIGIECHVQLRTKTKLFSGALANLKSEQPNIAISHIDLGYPGGLPVLNKEALKLAVRAAYALNTQPQEFSKFDRKHYFYPDLPMGYQISQFDEPIILGGYVDVYNPATNSYFKVNITRAHLEADAGKTIHPANTSYSLVDFNRAGSALLEIVSEPEMHSAKEARLYAEELYLLMRHYGVSDCDLYWGNMRFDVNVSISKTNQLGVRSELKNLNSFRSIERSIEYEMKRQIEDLESGNRLVQDTRGWDDTTGKSYRLRSKENADDYRYMPEPDIPPVILNKEFIEPIRLSLPQKLKTLRTRLIELGLSSSVVNILFLANLNYDQIDLNLILNRAAKEAQQVALWIVNIQIPLLDDPSQNKSIVLDLTSQDKLFKILYKIYLDQKISSTNLKVALTSFLQLKKLPDNIEQALLQQNLLQNSNQDELESAVCKVLEDNPKVVLDIKKGQDKAIGFLIGAVMKLTKNQANPGLAREIVIRKIYQDEQ